MLNCDIVAVISVNTFKADIVEMVAFCMIINKSKKEKKEIPSAYVILLSRSGERRPGYLTTEPGEMKCH